MKLEEIAPDFLLADFGVPVATPWSTGTGILDQNSEMFLDERLVMVDYVLNAPAAVAGQLGYGDSVTVGGRGFRVLHRAMRYSDGTWVQVPLQPAERSALPVPPMGGELIIDGNPDGDYDVLDGNGDG
jgi:hypothetical protein